MALVLPCIQPVVAHADVYWGATISGETYGETGNAPLNESAWDLFESHAGKSVDVLNMKQPWATFETAPMNATHARGAIPLVTMGLPQGVTLAEIASGSQDAAIKSWARAAKEWGHPFFFGPWWEMNGAWYPWGRDSSYVAAWRHFHDLVQAEGATNVTWTWVTNSLWADPESDPAPYYPGDAYVDWTGIDTYNWGRNPVQPDRWINPDQTITPTLDRVREIAPSKPVAIVEDASTEYGGNKTDWIREMLGTYLPHHPEIGAYLWFNWNFSKTGGREDWPIESSAPAQQAFRAGIQSSIYLPHPLSMPLLGKVPPPAAPAGGESPLPLDLSSPGQTAMTPQVAVAADGTATVVWSAQEGSHFVIDERRIDPEGSLGPVKHLSAGPGDAFSPQVAVGADGTATVVWIEFDGSNFVVEARRIAPDGSVDEPAQELSETGRDAGEPQVAVGPDGTASVVWKRFDGYHFVIKERQIAPDGTVGPPAHTLSESHQDAVEPQVAVGPDGAADVIWSRFNESNTVVQERTVAPDGTPEANTYDLSKAEENGEPTAESAVEPQLSIAGDGTASTIWTRFNGSHWIVQYRQLSAAGVPGLERDLSAPGQDAAEPQLAVSPEGVATAVWERFDGSSFIVQARRISAAGAPESTTRNLSAPGGDAAEPQISINRKGAGAVVWTRFSGSNWIAQERRLGPDGTPEASTHDLSAAGRSASRPQVALSPFGALTTVWKRFDGAHDIVQGSTAASPAMSLAPSSYDFGSIEVGSGSSAAVNVSNVGDAPLVVSSVSVSGADAGQFPLGGTASCTGAPIPPEGACQFSVSFHPSGPGPRQVVVKVLGSAGPTPGSIPVSGTGVAPRQPTAAAGTAQVDNSFWFGKPVLNRRSGTARLPVTVPGPGMLTMTGAAHASRAAGSAGRVMLPIAPHGALRRRLLRAGVVRLRVSVTYRPAGGTSKTEATFVVLRRALGGKRRPAR